MALLVAVAVLAPAMSLISVTVGFGAASRDLDFLLEEERALAELAALADDAGALGLYRDAATDEIVVVYPADHQGSFFEASGALGFSVRQELRAITRNDIDAIIQRLTSIGESRADAVLAFYFDPQLGVVSLEGSPPDAFAEVIRAFPGKLDYHVGRPRRDSRELDTEPFSGGAHIAEGYLQAGCTSAFAVKNSNGTRSMLTAGHCFSNNRNVYSSGNGVHVGITGGRSFPDPDLLRVSGWQYSKNIYISGETGIKSAVFGAADPSVGVTGYCRSGRVTFEKCGQTVYSLDGQLCANGCTKNLIVYRGGGWSQNGDSGAPFYIKNDQGRVYIRGLHVGTNESGTNMYAHRWTTIKNHYGVSIYTGQ